MQDRRSARRFEPATMLAFLFVRHTGITRELKEEEEEEKPRN